MSRLINAVLAIILVGLVVTAVLWFLQPEKEPDVDLPVVREGYAIPGNIADMVNRARLWAARHYEVPEDMVFFASLHFPYTSVLPDDVNHLVYLIDAESYEVRDEGSDRITSYRTLAVAVGADGLLTRHGESRKRSTVPLPVSRSTGEVRPYRPHRNEPFILLDLDYVGLALEALQEVDVAPGSRERLIPSTLTAAYKPYETRMERAKSVFISLFDPYDVPVDDDAENPWVEGYSILINPEGQPVYRGRARFGSMPRLAKIRALLSETPHPGISD